LLIYFIHKIISTQDAYFSKFYCQPSFKSPKLNGVIFAYESGTCASTVFLLLSVGNLKYGARLNRINIIFVSNFVLVSPVVRKLNLRIDMHNVDSKCHFMKEEKRRKLKFLMLVPMYISWAQKSK
jgi:hypothetical protein